MPRGLQRAAARFVTGPLAHFLAGFADWAELLARYGWARARSARGR